MSRTKVFFIIIMALVFCSSISLAQKGLNDEQNKQKLRKLAKTNLTKSKAKFTITPEEIKLGVITFEKSGEGIFTLKSTGKAVVTWSTEGPSGWKKLKKQKLYGSLERTSVSLQVDVRLLRDESFFSEKDRKGSFNNIEMMLESGGEKILCTKKLLAGTYKEEIKINSSQGEKVIFVTFIIAYTQENPLINLNLSRLDIGSILPQKTVSKKILLTNSGLEPLIWSVALRKHEKEDMPDISLQGRYISLINEGTRGSGIYVVPDHLKETVELTGTWLENNGYPSSAQDENIIKIKFTGTGIILYLLNYQKKGNLAVSLDKQLIDDRELFKDIEENKREVLIADKLAYSPHILTILSRNNNIVMEGMKILGIGTTFFPEKSLRIFPDSGVTTRQTNYLTVSLNAEQMLPGFYEDEIVFTTNADEAVVKVFAEVLPETISHVVDIYRYYNGNDYLFTADPQSETQRLVQNNYVKEGIAFRLFKPDTPGTASFYRWYNPHKRSHFYHYDFAGGKKDLSGYIFEGSIGNIATSKLTNTRELYRWYNPQTGHYFYSTDIQKGKIDKKIYTFDGIAGYVK
ncbi:MAG: hypothetical protein JW976_05965 [Syntrophaceae bacterium]|nr:hypothetical protein [Syntrophaceae bacterium]